MGPVDFDESENNESSSAITCIEWSSSDETLIDSYETPLGPDKTPVSPDKTPVSPDKTPVSSDEISVGPDETWLGPGKTWGVSECNTTAPGGSDVN